MTDQLIKCGERASRTACRDCGAVTPDHPLWWGHDLSRSGHKFCQKCRQLRSFLLLEADGTVHTCRTSSPAPQAAPSSPAPAPQAAPSLPAPSVNGGSDADQLAELIGRLAASSVSEAKVRSIVAGALADFQGQHGIPRMLELHRNGQVVATVKGAHTVLPDVLMALGAGESVLLVGPMGTGKSTIASHAADALGIAFDFMAVGPQTSKSDVLGYCTADGHYVASAFRRIYESGGVFLFDEMDAAHPGILTVINAALANGHASFPDQLVKRHPDAHFVAAANTYGRGPDRKYVGRQALDAATLDRFTVLDVEVDTDLEDQLCHATGLDAARVLRVLATFASFATMPRVTRWPLTFHPAPASVSADFWPQAGQSIRRFRAAHGAACLTRIGPRSASAPEGSKAMTDITLSSNGQVASMTFGSLGDMAAASWAIRHRVTSAWTSWRTLASWPGTDGMTSSRRPWTSPRAPSSSRKPRSLATAPTRWFTTLPATL